MTKKPSPQAPILLGKPMRKFAVYSNSCQWRRRVGYLMVVVTWYIEDDEGPACISWHIDGLTFSNRNHTIKGTDPQRAADAAGKVLEKLAKAIRGER